jgi:hypothetical protein
VVFYELDFGEVVKRKSNIITTCRELHELIAHNEAGIRVTEGTRAMFTFLRLSFTVTTGLTLTLEFESSQRACTRRTTT